MRYDSALRGDCADHRRACVLVDLGGELRATLHGVMASWRHGVMAFGRHPQRYPQTRNFRVECVAYAGDDRASEALRRSN